MQITFDNNIPIYIQLTEELTKYIISGYYKPKEKLPSVRELALELKVNPNTIQKSLQELETKGLIYTERTNGKYVTENIKLIEKYKKDYGTKLSKEYLQNMQSIGFSYEEIYNYIKEKEK